MSDDSAVVRPQRRPVSQLRKALNANYGIWPDPETEWEPPQAPRWRIRRLSRPAARWIGTVITLVVAAVVAGLTLGFLNSW